MLDKNIQQFSKAIQMHVFMERLDSLLTFLINLKFLKIVDFFR